MAGEDEDEGGKPDVAAADVAAAEAEVAAAEEGIMLLARLAAAGRPCTSPSLREAQKVKLFSASWSCWPPLRGLEEPSGSSAV